MFKIEDIAMLIKSFSEKRLKKTLNVKNMVFDENSSHEFSINRYKGGGKKCGYMLFFKIKQTVNQEEFTKRISESISEDFIDPLDLYYESRYYDEPQVRQCFKINKVEVLSKSKGSVGSRGNINYLKISIEINTNYYVEGDDYDIESKVKHAIRDIKVSQLRI